MDPVTIVIAVVGIVTTLISVWDTLFGKKHDAWDLMQQDQKDYLVKKAMEEAYTQRELYGKMPENYPQRIANYFWTFIDNYETQDNFDEWLKKNKGVKEIIKKNDEKYGRGFYQDPKEWKTPAFVGGVANGGNIADTGNGGNNSTAPVNSVNPLATDNSKVANVVGFGLLAGIGAFILKNIKS